MRVDYFINGLKDKDIRIDVAKKKYKNRTVTAAREEAIRLGVVKMQQQACDSHRGQQASSSSHQRAHGNGSSRSTASVGVSYAQASSSKQSYGANSSSGSRQQQRHDQRQASRQDSGTQPRHDPNHNNRQQSRQRPMKPEMHKKRDAAAWMHAMGIGELCLACCGNHKFEKDFATCSLRCPFCNYKFTDNDKRHLAADCKRRPGTADEVKKALKRHQRK